MRLLTEIEPMTFKLEGRHSIHCAEATASVFKAYICSKVKIGHSVCRTLVQIDDVIIRIKWRFEILKFPRALVYSFYQTQFYFHAMNCIKMVTLFKNLHP